MPTRHVTRDDTLCLYTVYKLRVNHPRRLRPGGRRRPRERSASGEGTRARILEAANELVVGEGFGGFTVEKVAERAGVSRMTVYYQFSSKQDLLEAVFDDIAARGRIHRLHEAFEEPDAAAALAAFVSIFCDFWASNRQGLRRLRSWAALESGAEEAGVERDEWRREGVRGIVRRLREQFGVPVEEDAAAMIDLIHTLTSFETYDALARQGRAESEIAGLVLRAALGALGMDPRPGGAAPG